MSESMGQLVLSFYSAASSKFIFVLAKAETDSTICATYRIVHTRLDEITLCLNAYFNTIDNTIDNARAHIFTKKHREVQKNTKRHMQRDKNTRKH